MRRVLGVFAKKPQPGAVKTRLANAIGPDLAARLYEAFLRDLLPRLEPLPFERILAYTPDDAPDYFRKLAGDAFRLAPQAAGDLGTRMSSFFADAFHHIAAPSSLLAGDQPLACKAPLRGEREGSGQVVLIGSDSPTLPVARIEKAYALLDKHDVVLGPSDDGGYYLIGMNRHIPEAFQQIDWSSDRVLDQTCRRLNDAGVSVARLDPWYDVDEPVDLERLRQEIASGESDRMSHTARILGVVRG